MRTLHLADLASVVFPVPAAGDRDEVLQPIRIVRKRFAQEREQQPLAAWEDQNCADCTARSRECPIVADVNALTLEELR
jgi:hypothetical protein